MVLARRELGVAEAPGAADNDRVLAYYSDAGHPEIAHDSVAWCAAFACAMLERSGTRSPRTLRAREFLEWGDPVETPRRGCIVVLWRGQPDGTEDVLVKGAPGSVTDPMVSFDGEWVYYSRFHDMKEASVSQGPSGGADIFKIHVKSRKIVQLTQQQLAASADRFLAMERAQQKEVRPGQSSGALFEWEAIMRRVKLSHQLVQLG